MNYFQNITRILKDYRNEVDSGIRLRDTKIQKANADYKDAYQKQKVAEAETDFMVRFDRQRIEHLGKISQEITAFKAQVKKQASTFNATTINEVIALKNIKLTPAEIKMFSEKYRGDYMAQRILSEIAESSGYRLNTVFADTLLNIIDEMEMNCANFIDGFDGNELRTVFTAVACQSDEPLRQYEIAFNNDVVPSVVKKELTESQMEAIDKMFFDCTEDADIQKRAEELSAISEDLKECLQAHEKYSKYIQPEISVLPLDEATQEKVRTLSKSNEELRELFAQDPRYAQYITE